MNECLELLTQNFKEALQQSEKGHRRNSISHEWCNSKDSQKCDCHCHDMCKGQSEVECPYLQKRSDEKLNLVTLVGKESDEKV